MCGQSLSRGFAASHDQAGQVFLRPTWDGNFGANHINRLSIATRLFSRGTQDCRTAGDCLAGQRTLVIRASHAGIEVNFMKPCAHVGLYGALGFAHCLKRRLFLPRIRSQVVSAKD